MSIAISVFTPTYNRKDTLISVYESLKNQSLTSFEWIIIDDGSSDGTLEVVNRWMEEKIIPIKYLYQENAGKHVAQNRALDMSEGELFLPLDSDDTVVPNCMKVLWETWESIPSDIRNGYSGVGCCCMDENSNLIGDPWPQDHFVSNDLEIVFKYRIKGEKWGPIRTDIMKRYKNEEVKGHYLLESTVWFRIAKGYKKVYINDCLRIYITRDDSVQKKKHFVDEANAEAKLEASKILVNEFWDWYARYNIRGGCIQSLIAAKAGIESGTTIRKLLKDIRPFLPKIMIIIASPYKLIYSITKRDK